MLKRASSTSRPGALSAAALANEIEAQDQRRAHDVRHSVLAMRGRHTGTVFSAGQISRSTAKIAIDRLQAAGGAKLSPTRSS